MSKFQLSKEISLNGVVREITMMELRNAPGEVMTAVELGAVFLVKRSGKPIAMITQPLSKTKK